MSWFRGKDKAAPRIPEPERNPYDRPADDDIPDEYENNRRALFAPQSQGTQGRGPSPSPRPQRNKYDEDDNEDEYAASRANMLRKGPPPPSQQAIAREANSIRAMPDRYNRSGGPNDAYSRGVRDLDKDRADLFAGATVPSRGGGQSPGGQQGGAGAGDGDDEDLEVIQKKTKDLKQQSVQSVREGLRMMREAEETGKNTLLKLGTQSGTIPFIHTKLMANINCIEQLGMTERHLQNSKGFVRRADDNTNDIKTLNRSIFIPAITFDKSKKRAEQDAKMNRRYEEEQAERDATQNNVRETHERIANVTRGFSGRRDGPPGDEDEEEALSGGGRFRTTQQMAARKAQWAKYQSKDDDEEDDAAEDEIADGLDEMSLGIARIKALALAQGNEVKKQNEQLSRLHRNVEDVDQRLSSTTEKVSSSHLGYRPSMLILPSDAPYLVF
jgi:protein transport protein SEC9